MRVSIKALAPLSALLFFSSCVTPPPMVGASRSIAYRQDGRRSERRPYAEPGYRDDRNLRDGYVDDRELRLADSRSEGSGWGESRWNEPRRNDGRFDDGRFATPRAGDWRGTPEPASHSPEPVGRGRSNQDGYYDDPFIDAGPPHERGDYTSQPNGRISFLFGRRRLNDALFEAAENPFAFGVEFSQVPEPGSLGFEFGFGIGRDDEDNVTLPAGGGFAGGIFNVERDMAEIYAGFRAEFGQSNIRPYIGGGGTLINISERRRQGFNEVEQDDNTVGAYLHGGVQFDLNDAFFLGVDFRRVFGARVDLFDQTFDTDYSQLAFTLGASL
jgi:hypothetical protein